MTTVSPSVAGVAAFHVGCEIEEARDLLLRWLAEVRPRQSPTPSPTGLLAYRGPKPWRLRLLYSPQDDRIVGVQATRTTAAHAEGRTLAPREVKDPMPEELRVVFDQRQHEWLVSEAAAEGMSLPQLVRVLVDEAMEGGDA